MIENIIKDKLLIIVAHPDDEILSLGGTINLLISKKISVEVICVTAGGVEDSKQRKKEIEKVADWSGFKLHQLNFKDCNLQNKSISIMKKIYPILNKHTNIITHTQFDIHEDHRIVNNIISRMVDFSKINFFAETEVLSSTNLAGQTNMAGQYVPNFYIDITAHIKQKIFYFDFYSTQRQNLPKLRNSIGIKQFANFRGLMCGFKYAESLKILFCK
jgi:N-acetylglucosamine malate deacetylase 1